MKQVFDFLQSMWHQFRVMLWSFFVDETSILPRNVAPAAIPNLAGC